VTFKFTVADLPGSQNSNDIYIPLSAFDQTLTFPFPNYESQYTGDVYYYFALRPAANSTQYTLGRSFLQEAYLTVDYERSNFSVSQAKFAADALTNTNIVAINPPANSNLTSSPTQSSSSLSTGAKIGIGVGAGVALLAIIILIAVCIWRRRRPRAPEPSTPEKPEDGVTQSEADIEQPLKPELLGDRRLPVEAPADASSSVAELSASPPDPIELQGSDVAGMSYYQPAKYNGEQSTSAYEETRRKLAAVEMPGNQNDDHSIAQEMPTSPYVQDHNDYEEQPPVHESHSLTTVISPTSASASASASVSASASASTSAFASTSVGGARFSGISLPQSSPGFPMPVVPDDFRSSAVSSNYTTYQQLVRHPVHDGTYVASDRASSRGSRFVEQGLQEFPPTPEAERTSFTAEDRLQIQGSDGSKRFSWEG
jgi:cytoskeletal protein RodZ